MNAAGMISKGSSSADEIDTLVPGVVIIEIRPREFRGPGEVTIAEIFNNGDDWGFAEFCTYK